MENCNSKPVLAKDMLNLIAKLARSGSKEKYFRLLFDKIFFQGQIFAITAPVIQILLDHDDIKFESLKWISIISEQIIPGNDNSDNNIILSRNSSDPIALSSAINACVDAKTVAIEAIKYNKNTMYKIYSLYYSCCFLKFKRPEPWKIEEFGVDTEIFFAYENSELLEYIKKFVYCPKSDISLRAFAIECAAVATLNLKLQHDFCDPYLNFSLLKYKISFNCKNTLISSDSFKLILENDKTIKSRYKNDIPWLRLDYQKGVNIEGNIDIILLISALILNNNAFFLIKDEIYDHFIALLSTYKSGNYFSYDNLLYFQLAEIYILLWSYKNSHNSNLEKIKLCDKLLLIIESFDVEINCHINLMKKGYFFSESASQS